MVPGAISDILYPCNDAKYYIFYIVKGSSDNPNSSNNFFCSSGSEVEVTFPFDT